MGNQYKTNIPIKFVPRFSQDQVDDLNSNIITTEDALRWVSDNLHPKVAKASSFGAEDAVVMDIMLKINPDFRFFTLDTGRLPQETYDIMDIVRKKYKIQIEVLFPDTAEVEQMVRSKGLNLFYDSIENRKLCCEIRKVHPMNRMLQTLDGWITGLRRDQTKVREDLKMFQIDHGHGGILKINPIINWSWDQIQDYIKKFNLPYNSLLDKGYPSIGCEPCTRPIKPGEDIRAGRWWWEQGEHKECGLHIERKRVI
jgi:phosphoadenosine phosphosulfate reductase